MSPPSQTLIDQAAAFEAQEDEFYAEVGGKDAWEDLAIALDEVGLGEGSGRYDEEEEEDDYHEDFSDGEEQGHFGLTHDEEMELLSQGVKPWDEDAFLFFSS